MAEVMRLDNAGGSELTQEQWEKTKADVRVVECPQRIGKPIYLLMEKDADLVSFSFDRNSYSATEIKGLFGPRKKEEGIDVNGLTSDLISGYSLDFFNAKGREIHPFGGNNYLSSGYLLDVNRDKIVERVEHTNWGVRKGYSVKSLSVNTVELKPKNLLHVVYEWHPDNALAENKWSYEMKDVDGDGDQDIYLGPAELNSDAVAEVKVTYLWDDEKKAYIGPDGKQGDHYKRLSGSRYEDVKKFEGLTYKVVKEVDTEDSVPTTRDEVMSRKLHPLPNFSTMTMDQLLEFFSRGQSQTDRDDKGFKTVFPAGMEKLSPKMASLLYVDSNRNAAHKRQYQLAVDDRGGVSPPDKGWMVYTQHSAVCYTSIKWLWAINIEKSCLLYWSRSANGGVGSNPFLDEFGYDIRIIHLKPSEAKYLTGVLWWLDRVRSQKLYPTSNGWMRSDYSYSSADGSCSLYSFCNRKGKSHFSYLTRWFGFNEGLASYWDRDYDKAVCGNFCGDFCQLFIPQYLGERWSRYAALKHRNLCTSDEERMKVRHSANQLDAIIKSFKEVFEMNVKTKVPAEVMNEIARACGNLGIVELKEELKKLKASIKPPSALELKVVKLEAMLVGKKRPYIYEDGEFEKEKLEKQFVELDKLKNVLRLDFDASLREALDEPLAQLVILQDPNKLVSVALGNTPTRFWAQSQLRRGYPSRYADVLLKEVERADRVELKEQAIELLISFSPEIAVKMLAGMNKKDKQFYCLSLARLYHDRIPDQMGVMLKWVIEKASNKKTAWRHRHDAVRLLVPSIFPQHEKEIYPLLVAIASEKVVDSGDAYNPHPHSICIQSLVQWPRAQEEWKRIKKLSSLRNGHSWDESSIRLALVSLSANCGPVVRKEVQSLVEERLLNGMGLVESQLEFIFEHGYRECLPLIERMATKDAKEVQHRRAVMGRSQSSFPTGRYSYHAARQLRALWGKTEGLAQARVWAVKALQNPEVFVRKNDKNQAVLKANGNQLVKMLMAYPKVKIEFLQHAATHKVNYMEHLALLRSAVYKGATE